jgi:hypothetical protein
MKIELDKEYPAKKIIKAFRAATKSGYYEIFSIQGEPIQKSSGLVSREGVKAYFAFDDIIKKYIFFGPAKGTVKRWGMNYFALEPLLVDSHYKQVDVTPNILYGANDDVTCFYFTNNPASPEFQTELPRWNKFTTAFYKELDKEE